MNQQQFDQYLQQILPGVRRVSVDGEMQWTDNSGFGGDLRAQQLEDLNTQLNSMRTNPNNGNPGMQISDQRQAEILANAAKGGFSDFKQIGKYLTPQENQQFDAWKGWVNEKNSEMKFGDYLAKGAMMAGTAAIGGAAMGAWGGGADAAAGWVSGADLPAGAMWGGEAGLSGGLGGDMGFFSDILGDGGFESIFSGGDALTLGGEQPWWANLGDIGMGDPMTAAGLGGGATAAGSGIGMGAFGDILTQAASGGSEFLTLDNLKNLYSGVKSLFGGGEGGGGFNLGSLLGGGLNAGVNAAPFLAAVNYAKNQDPFDTSRLTSLYDQYNPEAATFEYDQNTGAGRRNLTDSLTNRGVMGSSFGNSDITSFNTSRELGRNALTNQSVGVAGNLATSILDAQVKERALKNDLYGRALSGLGSALNPKSTIFG